jgi:tripartite-type tricarboxylate transporter receptor subunit TctC
MYPVANAPEAFAKYIAEDTEKWGRVIRDAGIPKLE